MNDSTCRVCGSRLLTNVKYCSTCGSPVSEACARTIPSNSTTPLFCSACGQTTDPESKFCMHCGVPIIQPLGYSSNNPPVTTWQSLPSQPMGNVSAGHGQPASSRKKRSGRRIVVASLSFLLITALLLTGFWKPGFFLSGRSGNYSYSGPSYAGNSEAFSITPYSGLTIAAEKNALDRDRHFEVEKITNESFDELSQAMEERGLLLMELFELDAGLEPEKRFPGTFSMTFDLAEHGIPEALYEYTTVYRISDDGGATELVCSLEDNSLICQSDRNCGIALTLVYGAATFGASFLGTSAVRDQGEKWTGLFDKDLVQLNLCDNKYRVSWAVEDSGEWKSKKEDLDKLYQDIRQSLVDEMTSAGSSSGYAIAQGFNHLLAARLAANQRYQELLDELGNTEWVIKNGTTIQAMQVIDGLIKIHNYMTEQIKLTPPAGKTDIILVYDWPPGDSAAGYAYNPVSAAPYVRINMSLFPADGRQASASIIDDVYLTLTHELSHVFQTNYTTIDWNANTVFWEATAIMLETQARDDYLKNKKETYPTISTRPALTDSDWFETLSVTFGKFPASGDEQDYQRFGYTLSRFLTFLQDEGFTFNLVDLLESYKTTQDYRAAVQLATGMSDTELGGHYRQFCENNTQRFYQRYQDALKTIGVKSTLIPPVPLSAVQTKARVAVADAPLSAYIREFRVDTSKVGQYALLLVSDDSLKGKKAYHLINMTTGVAKTTKGLFYPVRTDPSAYIFEIHAYGRPDNQDASYFAYLLTTPRAPELSVDKDSMIITMPPVSQAAQDGLIDGYLIKITASNGNDTDIHEEHVPYEQWNKPLKLQLDRLFSLNGDISYSITVQEYMKGQTGQKNLYGPASLEMTHESEKPSEEGVYSGIIPFSNFDSEGSSGSTSASDQPVTIEVRPDGTGMITFDYSSIATEKWAPATDTSTTASANISLELSSLSSYSGEVSVRIARTGTYQGNDVSSAEVVQWPLKINWNETSGMLNLQFGYYVYQDILLTKSGS